MPSNLDQTQVDALIHGDYGTPFQILGKHPHTDTDHEVLIRAMQPGYAKLTVITDQGQRVELERIRVEGLFEGVIAGQLDTLRYHFEGVTHEGEISIFHDPYAFRESIFSEIDWYLLREGRHLSLYDKLGAHPRELDGVRGVNFAVWAPNARAVSVIGDFNRWDERIHAMNRHGDTGVWELFIPEVQPGAIYRYDIRSYFNNYRVKKSDPYGFYGERRPNNASIVADLSQYSWEDSHWLAEHQEQASLDQPMSIYEVHLGSWMRKSANEWLTYRDLAHELVNYVKKMGYTHIELMPITEHPLDASWGYQVTGFFAVTSRYGTPQDFMYFVDQCHQNGIGVILDWVPAHFPRDAHGLAYFDGTHLYEHADPRQGAHPDWGTYIFNYGRNEVRSFLLSNALFWLKVYHIDGLRVDAVSSMLYLDFSRRAGEWIPNKYGGNENLEAIQFLKDFNTIVHSECPQAFTIAEESTAWAMVSRPTYIGGLGFTYKWNMGWMHDTLKYIQTDPLYRRYNHNLITFSLFYAFSENFTLSLSHDEVVHGKGALINKAAGDWWQKFATMRLLFGFQYTHPGKKLNFMGQEIGQWQEWSETRSLDWHLLDHEPHQRLQRWVRDLNHLYKSEPALYEHDFDPRGFRWIEANDADQSIFSYLRFADDPQNFLVILCNFTPIPRHHYRIGVPELTTYDELLNSDSQIYGGSNLGNKGSIQADPTPWHHWLQSLSLTIPPLSILILKPNRVRS